MDVRVLWFWSPYDIIIFRGKESKKFTPPPSPPYSLQKATVRPCLSYVKMSMYLCRLAVLSFLVFAWLAMDRLVNITKINCCNIIEERSTTRTILFRMETLALICRVRTPPRSTYCLTHQPAPIWQGQNIRNLITPYGSRPIIVTALYCWSELRVQWKRSTHPQVMTRKQKNSTTQKAKLHHKSEALGRWPFMSARHF